MIGIYGGTFDPIHIGHLRIALDVQQFLNLEQVRFIPLATPAHKNHQISSAQDRLTMLKAATIDQKNFVIDPRELTRQGISYTVDTLLSLRKEFPHKPLVFMLGSDAFAHIKQWSRTEQILQLVHLIVMQRPDQPQSTHYPQHHCKDPARLQQTLCGHIIFYPVTQLDISSSQIRQLIQQHQSARYLTPDPVINIIQDKQLYQI